MATSMASASAQAAAPCGLWQRRCPPLARPWPRQYLHGPCDPCCSRPCGWTPRSSGRRRMASATAPTLEAPTSEASPHAAPEPVSQHLLGKRCIVVGAGPSGALSAIHLARLGASVDVYERTLGTSTSIGPRSYSLSLTRRALVALEEAGIQLPTAELWHPPSMARYTGSKKPAIAKIGPWSRVINRGTLAGLLVAEAQRLFPDRIKIHFGATLSDLDLAARTATFAMEDGSSVSMGYDLLVGADGVNSRVRAFLQSQVPGFTFTQLQDEMEFRTLELPPHILQDADPDFRTRNHVLIDTKRNASIIAFPNAHGQIRGVYIRNRGEHGSMRGVEDYVRDMKASFPALREEDLPTIATELLSQPVSNGGLNTRCSQLHGPSAVLVGDAGHGMWPSLGQGANAALESAGVLGRVLGECKDLSEVPERFNALRHEDALAIVELTERGFGGKNSRVVGPAFMLVLLQGALHHLLPWLVPKPALFTMNDTLNSYSEIKRKSEAHKRVMELAVAAAAVALAFLVLQWAVPAAGTLFPPK